MPESVRNLRLHIIRADNGELAILKDRIEELGCCNRGAVPRKMAIDGYLTNVDLARARERIPLQCRGVNDLEQMAKYAQAHNEKRQDMEP